MRIPDLTLAYSIIGKGSNQIIIIINSKLQTKNFFEGKLHNYM